MFQYRAHANCIPLRGASCEALRGAFGADRTGLERGFQRHAPVPFFDKIPELLPTVFLHFVYILPHFVEELQFVRSGHVGLIELSEERRVFGFERAGGGG